jgi:hypothetical protein
LLPCPFNILCIFCFPFFRNLFENPPRAVYSQWKTSFNKPTLFEMCVFWKYFPKFSSKTDCLATVFRKFFENMENKQCPIRVLPGSDQFLLCLVGNCTTNCFQVVKNTWTFTWKFSYLATVTGITISIYLSVFFITLKTFWICKDHKCTWRLTFKGNLMM